MSSPVPMGPNGPADTAATEERQPIGAQAIGVMNDSEMFTGDLLREQDARAAAEQQARHGRFAAILSRRLAADGIDVPPEAIAINFSTGEILDRRVLAQKVSIPPES
jgi:hypothetical protein